MSLSETDTSDNCLYCCLAVPLSGFGNVSWGVAKKLNELGAKVVSISGPDGYIYDKDGISGEKVDYMVEMRGSLRDRLSLIHI